MSLEKKNLYEGMYVLSSTLSEDARNKAFERIIAEISGNGGEIHKVHEQGRRKLAYEINDYREGYYYLVYFSVAPESISEIRKEYHLNEDLVRFMIIRTEVVAETLEFKSLVEQ